MNTDDHDNAAAGIGREVGAELGAAVADLRTVVYRFARRARWFDGGILLVLLVVLPCFGVWWPVVAAVFATSFTVDLVLCSRLNPRRSEEATR